MNETDLRRITVLRAFKPGDVVILETDRVYSVTEHERIAKMLSEGAHGIKFVLLVAGMRVAGREEIVSPESLGN